MNEDPITFWEHLTEISIYFNITPFNWRLNADFSSWGCGLPVGPVHVGLGW